MSQKVEQAAIEWVLGYERSQARVPVDKRYVPDFPGDIESPPRIIEVKATSTSYRGWFLPLEPIQHEHALADPAFHIYVVENIGQGDPAAFTLRILSGDRLRALAEKSKERRYFEMSWPVASYDQTPMVGAVADGLPPPDPVMTAPAVPAPTSTGGAYQSEVSNAIEDALRALGGEADLNEIVAEVERSHPGRWRSVETDVADLVHPGGTSSGYPPEQRILERVSRGRYRLRA